MFTTFCILAGAVFLLLAQDVRLSLRGGDGILGRILRGESVLRRKRDRVRLRLDLLLNDKRGK
jgi:hypothetical protein